MKCQEERPLVEKLADGEATVEERARAEAHLEKCETCRAHFGFLTSVAETRRSQPLAEPTEAYWSSMTRNILNRIAEEEGSRGQASYRAPALVSGTAMRFVGLAAGVVLAVAVVWNVLIPRRDAPSSSEVSSPAVARPSIVTPVPEDEEALREPASPPAFEAEPMRRRADAEAREQGTAEVVLEGANEPEPQRAAKSTDEARVLEASPVEDFAPAEARDAPRASAAQRPSAETTRARAAEETLSALGSASNLSRPASEAEPQPNCERFREALETLGEGEGATDLKFQLARCELARYESEPSEETLARAIADAEAFLVLESEGRRAEEIRRALSRVPR